jgi:hypothetical protein
MGMYNYSTFDLTEQIKGLRERYPEATREQAEDAMRHALYMLSTEISEHLENSYLWKRENE